MDNLQVEDELASELKRSTKMHNPYTSRSMVKNIEYFFGRAEALETIFGNIGSCQHTSIVGERRIGKSSLLWHITQAEIREKYKDYLDEETKPYLFVFFDLQRVASLTQETFFKLLSECLMEELPPGYVANKEPNETAQDFFERLVRKTKKDYFLVICIDEFETVVNNEKFDKGFLYLLRSYGNAQDVIYVTASRLPLADICQSTEHIQGSDFWNIFTSPLYLRLLTIEEARHLITTPARKLGIDFAEEEINFAIEVAGCHPLFLEICCFYLFETKKKSLALGKTNASTQTEQQAILANFLMAAEPHYESLWSKLNQTEKSVLANFDTVDPQGDLKNVLQDLVRRGLLYDDPIIRPFSSTFQAFIQKHYTPDRNAVTGLNSIAPSQMPIEQLIYEEVLHTPDVDWEGTTSKLDIWVGQNQEVLVTLSGPYTYAQFCQNRAKAEHTFIQRFDNRVKNLLSLRDWRPEKFQIAKDVVQFFETTPEVAQAYTKGRAITNNDDRFLITFRCSEEMLSFPFEFIRSLSTVDENEKDLALIHPVRRSILGLTTRNRPLATDFFQDPDTAILLVSSNASGPVVIDNRGYDLPAIPGARKEVEEIEGMIRAGQKQGRIRCSLDVKHDPSVDEMKELLKSNKYDVVHYSGHAMYCENPENSSMFFCQAGRSPSVVAEKLTTNQLNYAVRNTRLKLFYLSCCEGAKAGTSDALLNNNFLGIANALLIGGVPSVLSMRWPLNDTTAIHLARLFYRELLSGSPMELALSRARRQLESSHPEDYSWLSPVLVVQDKQ